MKIRFLISFVLISSIILAQAPDRNYFRPPVDIPLILSGNFGELRSNHFHSGIDIKTQGKTGLPIYAAADGEISRIKISPYGFGLALYLDHPNGQTTVYGHLLSFRDDIQEYAKNIQYERQSFDVDLAVPKGTFSVNKGDQIALSGNTGGSGGPHLHFEIRDTDSQHPLNPLLFNFPIKDEIKPKILSAAIYPLTDDSHVYGKTQKTLIETVFYDGAYHLKGNPTVPVYGNIGFGLQTIDYLDGSWSKCGIYEIKLKVDNQAIYSFQMNKLSFDETRYLNSYIDYDYYRTNYRRLQKSWVEPGNKLSNYRELINGGIVDLSDGEVHDIDYEITDTYGNKSTLSFRVQSKKMNIVPKERNGQLISYKQKTTIEKEQLKAVFEPGTFYSDFYLDLETKPANNLYYSKLYKIQDDHHPVHQHYSLKIKADAVPPELQDKALIAAVSEKSGRKWSMGGNYENGWITARVRQLGTFAISVDTVAPTIKPLSIYNNSRLTESSRIRFKISDDFSGIASYNGQIDGNWVLFEYDAKNALITYYFDKKRFQFDQKHELKLRVKDGKGNTTEYLASFYK
ncbi:M23 family metallopeptidase [Sunxiuqinia indica]|uniref:M23 family metallopeptidase n=1 Tax=Sunxiuqinia indica TaxID=2692584 RepID=UPI0013578EAC|nr:M23 family metallopeptidase [Sunxiuqinia indica]